jgi:hypothetical protein
MADDDEFFVAVDGRDAIRGFDYSLDAVRSLLVFRDDFDPVTMEFQIMYRTPEGLSSFGNWRPEDGDKYAYLEARHLTEMIARRNRDGAMDYYLDPSAFEGGKPRLVLRAPTIEEKAATEALSMPVTKSRFSAADSAISKEVGFDARTPKAIDLGTGRGKYVSTGKMVDETAEKGRLKRTVNEFYTLGGSMLSDANYLDIRFSDTPIGAKEAIDEHLVIERKSFDVGATVLRECVWGTRGRSREKPDVVALAVYSWKDRGVYFQLNCDDSQSRDAETAIARIVKYRSKAN